MKPGAPVTIAGAGLVGSLLALFLAKRGFDVECLERRPDLRLQRVGEGRSINLAISTRGLHALAQVGLERQILDQAIPMRGRMIHPVSGPLGFQPYGIRAEDCIHSISRGALNQVLMSRAEESGRVRIRFNERGETALAASGVVFGADGAGSAVRRALEERGRVRTAESLLEHGYKELILPAGPGGSYLLEKNALHIWPRGTYMLIALPNADGSFTCTLFLPMEGALSFGRLVDESSIHELFSAQFPDALALIPDLAAQFLAHPTGRMVTVKCEPWHSATTCLIGDAAHAIVPFYGQGMNCGFEDCEILDGLLDKCADWPVLFERFFVARKTNADAIADMAVENFVEMRDKVAQPGFQLERKVERLLQEKFPGEYVPRYSLVTFSRVPYRKALETGQAQARILAELCHGIAAPEQVDLARARELIRARL
jgi:kynurenine 3-monooxygenase